MPPTSSYTIVYVKVQINGDTHGEVMSNIRSKPKCPLSPILFSLYIEELETYLDEIGGDLHVYLIRWLSFFYMLMILLCSLNQDQAYKDF